MKLIIQRVTEASVKVEGETVGKITAGALILLSVGKNDTESDADFLAEKILHLRIFEDEGGKMNLSALETNAQILVVSQFTLHGDCQKGRRPSFDKAADPHSAQKLYEYFVSALKKSPLTVETGRFRATMKVSLVNDGPVTFSIDSPSEKNF